MKMNAFAIFDERPQHCKKPYIFHLENGEVHSAIYKDFAEAEAMCEKMNKLTTLTHYIVKQI